MAINQTNKQLNIANKLADQAAVLDDAADDWASLVAQYAQAGTFTDATLEASELKHFSAADLATLVTRFGDLVIWLNGSNRRDILRKVRK